MVEYTRSPLFSVVEIVDLVVDDRVEVKVDDVVVNVLGVGVLLEVIVEGDVKDELSVGVAFGEEDVTV